MPVIVLLVPAMPPILETLKVKTAAPPPPSLLSATVIISPITNLSPPAITVTAAAPELLTTIEKVASIPLPV